MCEDTEEDTEYALADKVVPQTGWGNGVDVFLCLLIFDLSNEMNLQIKDKDLNNNNWLWWVLYSQW